MDKTIIDICTFQKDVGLDDQMLEELYLVFCEEIKRAKEDMNRNFSLSNLKEVKKIVHDLKGIASSYKAYSIFEDAKRLDAKLKCEDFDDIKSDILDLSEDIEVVIKEITQYFDENRLP